MNPTESTSKVTQVVLSVVAAFLSLRFLLRLFNADATNRMVKWIYEMTAPIVHPLSVVFPLPRTGDGFVLEFTTLIALVGYSFVAFAILSFAGSYRVSANSVAPKPRFNVTFKKKPKSQKTKKKPAKKKK